MKIKSYIVGFILLYSFGNRAIAQESNKLYFLVDTVNIPKEQRIVRINKTVPHTLYENEYEFFCKCITSHHKNLIFFYSYTKIKVKEPVLKEKPDYQYISWKELVELVEKYQYSFDKKYEFHIVEVLPNNTYKVNRVQLVRYATVK